jgi:polyisoprenoid-binding protein YceI
MRKTVLTMATLFLLGVVFASVVIINWKIGTGYSIKFSSKDVSGIFKKFSGTVSFDETNLPASSFNLAIDVASINTGNGLQNKHAKSEEWFDAAKYPEIKFTSAKIDKTGNGYSVKGTMELHGVKKEISIPFSFTKNGNNGVFSASFTVKRSDYNVGKPGGDVAEDIKIDVKVPVAK